MINIKQKVDCCGCTACANVCAHDAITMQPDDLGFKYPFVDANKCVNCGLCNKVCQFHDNYNRYDNYDSPLVYYARRKNEGLLSKSQSGGVFYAIAEYVLHGGGIVYGAAFKESFKVCHIRATNNKEIESLRMSKYVQSDMCDIFKSVKADLKSFHTVLFSGTACQIAGLKSYIPIRLHEKLICIDVICHGVSSPQIWSDYIEYLEHKYNSRIKKACFRDKRFGWHGATESFLFSNGKEIFARTNNHLYFSGLSFRESCHNCYYTNIQRVGDITLGDYWGLPKESPYEKDAKGLSLVLINSDKGKKIYEKVRESMYAGKVETNNYLQPQLLYPTKRNPKHKDFVYDYNKYGFLMVARKYGYLGWNYKLHLLKKHIRSLFK